MIGESFDPTGDVFIHDRLRPHWSQAGAIVFVTFRSRDSIPRDLIARWDREKQDWVERALGICHRSLRNPSSPECSSRANNPTENPRPGFDQGQIPDDRHWTRLLPFLTTNQRHEFDFHFARHRETTLDECLGTCVLKRPACAEIVADSLMHFDGDRYRMGDFVVMPNHVHLLASFATPESMERQFDSWLHYSAMLINRELNTSGSFWQQEPFDHLVRSPEQYNYLRGYIAKNPIRARLTPGQFLYRKYDG